MDSRLDAIKVAARKVQGDPLAGTPVRDTPSSRVALAMTLSRLQLRLSIEPLTMGALALEYREIIESNGLNLPPLPPGPLARLCQGAGVSTIQHEGKTCVTWTKPTKAFVSQTLADGERDMQAAKPADQEPVTSRGADRPHDDDKDEEPADVAAVEASVLAQAFDPGDDIDFASDFHGLPPAEAKPAASVAVEADADIDFFADFRARTAAGDEWTMFTRERHRTGDDVAYVRKGSIVITPRAAASVGLAKGSKVVLFSGRTGRIKVQLDADSPHALTMTGDGSTNTLKVSAHAFVRDHRLTLGRYRLEPIGAGTAVLTLVEAATPAA